jgi:hypothetical protein
MNVTVKKRNNIMKEADLKEKLFGASEKFKELLLVLQERKYISEQLLDEVSKDPYSMKNAHYIIFVASFYGNIELLKQIIDKDNISIYLKNILEDKTITDNNKAKIIEDILSLENKEINEQLIKSENSFLTLASKNNLPITLNKLAELHKKLPMSLDYNNALNIALASKFPKLVWVLSKNTEDGQHYAEQYADNLLQTNNLDAVIAFCQEGWLVKNNKSFKENINKYIGLMNSIDKEVKLIFKKYSIENIYSDILLQELRDKFPELGGTVANNSNLLNIIEREIELLKESENKQDSQGYFRKILSNIKIFFLGDKVLNLTSKIIAAHIASPNKIPKESYLKDSDVQKDIDLLSLFLQLKEQSKNKNEELFYKSLSSIFQLKIDDKNYSNVICNLALREIPKFLANNNKELDQNNEYFKDLSRLYNENPKQAKEDILELIDILKDSENSTKIISNLFSLLDDKIKKELLKDNEILSKAISTIDDKELIKNLVTYHEKSRPNDLMSIAYKTGNYNNFSALLSSGYKCNDALKEQILKDNKEDYILKLASKGVISVKDIEKVNKNLAAKIKTENVKDKASLSPAQKDQLAKKEGKVTAKKSKISKNKIYQFFDFITGSTEKLDDRLKAKSLLVKKNTNSKPISK